MAIDTSKVRILKHFGQTYYPVAHAESTIYRNGPNQEDRETVAGALNTIVNNISTISSGLNNRYTKTEVNNLLDQYISRIHQFEYVNVDGYRADLPQASESTMYKIYLVKASNSEVANIKDEFITLKTPIPIHSGNIVYFGLSDGTGKPTAEMINEGDILIYSDNPLNGDSYEIKENGNLEGYTASAGDIIVDAAHDKYYTMNNNGTAWVEELGQLTYTYSWEQIGSTAIDVSDKANKVANATSGNFAGLNSNGDLVDSGSKPSDFKPKQTAVTSPSVTDQYVDSFIDTISQDANGVITATKKYVYTTQEIELYDANSANPHNALNTFSFTRPPVFFYKKIPVECRYYKENQNDSQYCLSFVISRNATNNSSHIDEGKILQVITYSVTAQGPSSYPAIYTATYNNNSVGNSIKKVFNEEYRLATISDINSIFTE